MGNDEAIIYGDRHGEQYREFSQSLGVRVDSEGRINDEDAPPKTYYPNAIAMNCIGGEVQIGVVTFDQSTGERNRFYGDNDNEQWDSLWASLDRQGLNRLIREARRLRDRAYGKDE